MRQLLDRCISTLMIACVFASGCTFREASIDFDTTDMTHYQDFAKEIEYPDVESLVADDLVATPAPMTLSHDGPREYRDLPLQEAIETALTNAEVLRDLQGLVLTSPNNASTIQDPAIAETDPYFGIESALSEFDAQLETSAFFENNDRALNNTFFGGGTRLLTQDLNFYRTELSKRTATGADFALRHNIEYDFNNSPGNDTPNRPWDINLEAEFRQPLFQGAGVEFNRIAGPNSTAGRPHGVLIARLNSDISLADFEISVRDFISDVENAYWELYFAYRDLDARIAARDRALETWRRIHTLNVNERRGGEAQKEAQAREQYYRLQEEVENALSGRILDRSRYDAFRGTGGVYSVERRLRLLMGEDAADGRLLRPTDEPIMAQVVFDWNQIVVEALARRAELRRQKWHVKRAELELVASNNFLKPRVDAVGRYRFRGLGSDLLDPQGNSPDRLSNAYGTMLSGDFQEWQLGVEFSAPLGYRLAHTAVRNAELKLARARSILDEQQRTVVHELSGAFAEMDRAYVVSQTNYNRRLAAKQQLEALEAVYEDADQNEKTRLLDLLLDAQRRLADAESRYYRSLVEYALSVKRIHRHKGSLLDYCEVYLAEGPWPGKAYYDACRREQQRGAPKCLTDYRMRHVPIVSQGPYSTESVSAGATLLPGPLDDLPSGESIMAPLPPL